MRRHVAAFALALTLTSGARAADRPPGASDAELDQLVTRAMQEFAVPGVAVGIVKDGQVIFAKGYGVRAVGSDEPVGPDTLFGIGSTTKAFTAAALAMLVDEKKLGWDDRVVQRLPQFKLYDPYVTREFTVRDLLTHRSGLGPGAGDLLAFPDTDFKRSEILERLRYLKPVTSFRTTFAYDNLLYMVAGELIPAVTGTSWEDFVETRLLQPLQMRGCVAAASRIGDTRDVARPHVVEDGAVKQVKPVDVSVIGAAGGIQCNVNGLTKWMALQLDDGAKLYSAERQHEMWTPQTLGPVPPMLAKLHRTYFRAYGLGWNLEDFEGTKRVFHSGGLLGMVAQIALLPEQKLGVVVLANQQADGITNAITLHVAKAYLGTGQKDWVALYKSRADQQRAAAKQADETLQAELAKAPKPQAATYVGRYRDAWRGDATVRQEGGRLLLAFSRTKRMEGVLLPYKDGTFVVRWNDRSLNADAFVRFGAGTMRLETLPSADDAFDYADLDFRKVPAR